MRQLLTVKFAFLLAGCLFWATPADAYYYTVQQGDSLSLIARRHGMSADKLAKTNRLTRNANLVAGSRLWVPGNTPKALPKVDTSRVVVKHSSTGNLPRIDTSKVSSPLPRQVTQPSRSTAPAASADPSVHVVQPGESLWALSRKYGVSIGDLAAWNGISEKAGLEIGQRLRVQPGSNADIPGGGVVSETTTARQVANATVSSTGSSGSNLKPSSKGYIWPAEGRLLRKFRVSSDEKYTGIDIGVPSGSEVRAVRDGTVVYVGDSIPGYGMLIILEHSGNMASCYAHMGRALVREGQSVNRGQVVGRSGKTDRGEEFLHLELRLRQNAVDPLLYLP